MSSSFVIDSSAALELMTKGDVPDLDLTLSELFAPELIDLEFLSVTRKLVLRKFLAPHQADRIVSTWSNNTVIRFSHLPLLARTWELRHGITPYDASYVALAEHLRIPMLTADRRLARAAAAYCEIVVIGTAV